MSENTQSQTLLYPVLEDDVIMCPHGGRVQLKSIKGKPFQSDGVPIILEPDMQNALISGCTNNILGVPTPCTMVVNIPPAALSLKTLNGEKAVMQDYVSLIMTDKGFPLINGSWLILPRKILLVKIIVKKMKKKKFSIYCI